MPDPLAPGLRRPVRRASAAALGLLLALSATGCTGDTEEPEAKPSPAPSEGSVATLEPKPAPAVVRVTRVAGRMADKDREVLADNVGKVVTAYFDDAFLGGEYPRSDFGNAFATFSPGAAREARRDRDLLTNRDLGPSTESVVARRQTAYLAVLAPYKVAAGVTARVELRFLAERGDAGDKLVTVKGRLLLTRKKDGSWQIFGYDLTQAARPTGEES